MKCASVVQLFTRNKRNMTEPKYNRHCLRCGNDLMVPTWKLCQVCSQVPKNVRPHILKVQRHEEVLRLYKLGMSYADIAKQTKYSKSNISKLLSDTKRAEKLEMNRFLSQ